MPSSFEILNIKIPTSAVCAIELRRTSTKQCPRRFLAFRHQDGSYTTAVIAKKPDIIEWTPNAALSPSEFLQPSEFSKFDVTYWCPDIQYLAACMFNLEEYFRKSPAPTPCFCVWWVDTVIRDYQRKRYIEYPEPNTANELFWRMFGCI